MEHPIKIDDLGGTPILGNPQISPAGMKAKQVLQLCWKGMND
jgi:hypothetical protein